HVAIRPRPSLRPPMMRARGPRASTGSAFPIWPARAGGFALLTQQGFNFLARNTRPGIIGGGLHAALEQFPAQIGMGFQFLMFAQDHEHGFGRVEELALFYPVEQPQGQRGRQIGFKSRPTLCDLVAAWLARPRGPCRPDLA